MEALEITEYMLQDKKENKVKSIDKIKIIIIILLIIILGIMLLKYNSKTENNFNMKESNIESVSGEATAENETIVTSKTQIQSALTENVSLHATYYLEEIYVQTNESIKQGEAILKYTNGEYLTAPYDCVINEINIPDIGTICKNDNYINISSTNRLQVTMNISEDIINQIYIGQPADITITSLDESVTGNITNISSTASNGNFTVLIEFENSSDIKIGMSATVKI